MQTRTFLAQARDRYESPFLVTWSHNMATEQSCVRSWHIIEISRCIPLTLDSTSHSIAPHIQASESRSVTGRLPILLRLLPPDPEWRRWLQWCEGSWAMSCVVSASASQQVIAYLPRTRAAKILRSEGTICVLSDALQKRSCQNSCASCRLCRKYICVEPIFVDRMPIEQEQHVSPVSQAPDLSAVYETYLKDRF